MKKRIVSIFLCLFVLLLPLYVTGAAFADAPMTVFCESFIAKPGDTVKLDLKMKNNNGFSVLNLALIYDRENLELEDIENKLAGFVMSTDSAILWDGNGNCTKNGKLATLTFKVKESAVPGDYEIKVKFFEASDYDGYSVSAVTDSGKIAVRETLITGDSDGDGEVNAADLVAISKMLLNIKVYCEPLDTNGDSKIDIKDLARLKKYVADNTVQLLHS